MSVLNALEDVKNELGPRIAMYDVLSNGQYRTVWKHGQNLKKKIIRVRLQ